MAQRLGILIFLLLGGCGVFHAFKPYELPSTGPRAKVAITKNVADIPGSPGGAYFLLDIIEPDDKCNFDYKGSIVLDPEQDPNAGSRTIVMPAGRAYFRVFIKHPSIIKNVSFVLEENQEYSIDYKYLGHEGYDKIRYELNFVKKEGENRLRHVDVDHWSVCKREKGIVSN
jgi:hypothetical protein